MSKPKSITLEYIGANGRCFRGLPVLEKGSMISVEEKKAEALLLTKKFKLATASAGKEGKK